ncbi:2,5-diamino-6-(ribosylamino)-4(3H)-pyrimidinone 5'-phosphate reductase [Candidatus Nitrosopelagicus sp.]|uniref:2,5-diamino-6-(ribosylamino)-4(3H)-pyrimidinone 5'-phosphate reductase n=1 Tax=uncultured marine thaumarchaeote KM3_24_H04 TaxID=1456101 RepID=A0A075GXW0_9ARCH|nr:deaminase-reductase domain-containing protein (RIB7, arfC) [uncultured marine thaumarchaeote KM3_24_H04]MDC0193554.1 2,5-diamino-6-(ribosylamino)-4(3H)-pyrimidinone 5'-phosphate reductase [Candidatus Nitrosopelagicus sp.]
MEKSRPYVILSAAMTLDGKIGKNKTKIKLSSKKDKTRVHRLRANVDGILIGKNTLDADNPMLSVRYSKGKNPVRILLDSRGTIKSSSKIIQSCNKIPTIIATTNLISKKNLCRLEKFPLEVIKCGKTSVDTVKLLKLLYKKDIKKILLEGGGTINWTFLKNGFVDEIIVTITPYILGGSNSISLVEGVGFKNLFPTKKLKLEKIQKIGSELVVYYRI